MVSQAVGEGMSAIWGARYAWCDQETSEGFISVVRSVATVAAVVFTFFALAGVPPGMAPSVSHGLKLTTAMMKGATCNWNPAMITFSVAAITDFICHLLQMKSTKDEDAEKIRSLEEREAELLATNQSLVEDNVRLASTLDNKGYRIEIEKIIHDVNRHFDAHVGVIINSIHRIVVQKPNSRFNDDIQARYIDNLGSFSLKRNILENSTQCEVASGVPDTHSVTSEGNQSAESVNEFVVVSENNDRQT